MFFVYSIELDTLKVQLYDCCNSKDVASNLLSTCATNFIRGEHGDRRAAKAFKDTVSNDELTEDGYFLRNSGTKIDQINVHLRKTHIYNGWTGKGAIVDVKQTMIFGLTESAMGMPIEVSGRSATRPSFDNEAQSQAHTSFIGELTLVLKKRRQSGYSVYDEDLKID